MIEGVSGSGMQSMGIGFSMNQNGPLTDDQKSVLTDILSKYDPANMTEEDKKSLMDELKESGIPPSREARELIENSGFEMGKPPEGSPPAAMNGESQRPEFIQEAIDKYEAGELTDEDIKELITNLKKTGEQPQGILFDQTT